MHLAVMHKLVERVPAHAVVMSTPSPTSPSWPASDEVQVDADAADGFSQEPADHHLFTSLTHAGDALEQTEVGISSLMDTWLLS